MFPPSVVFDAAADGYDLDRYHATVADQLVVGIQRTDPPALIIDVATGTGAVAFSALRHLAPRRVVAVDISPRMLDRARAKAPRHDPDGRIEWRSAPALPLDIGDGSADVVLCASSLHFLGRAALDEWLRVLRPGGLAAFSLPHAADFTPSPSFRAVLADDVVVPSNGAQAAEIALDAGFHHVIVRLTSAVSRDRPRRAFLVWAALPIGTERSILKQARINRRPR